MRAIPIACVCAFEGCGLPATHIAEGSPIWNFNTNRFVDGHIGIGFYCEDHANDVADEGSPEYVTECPNCGCVMGCG